jgi:PHP family Zn ribbon phosphoesterase
MARFKLIPSWDCEGARANIDKECLEEFAHGEASSTSARCRQCGGKITAGEQNDGRVHNVQRRSALTPLAC